MKYMLVFAIVFLVGCSFFDKVGHRDDYDYLMSFKEYIAEKDYENAEKSLLYELDIEENEDIYSNLAWISYQRNDETKMLEYLNKSLDINSSNELALRIYSYYYLGKRDYEKSEEMLQKALEANPDSCDVHMGLARIAHHKGELDKVTRYKENALQLNPDCNVPDLLKG